MSTRTYQDAVEHLNSLQSNAATLEAVRVSGGRASEFAIPEMIEYLERVGYTVSKFETVLLLIDCLTYLLATTTQRSQCYTHYWY
jgi:ribulose kinase